MVLAKVVWERKALHTNHMHARQARTVKLSLGRGSGNAAPSPFLSSACLLIAGLCLGALLRAAGPIFVRECFRPVSLIDFSGLTALIAALFSAVACHEAGHFLAALTNDFEIWSVVIGPFRITRVGASWKLTLKKQRLFEASVSAFPRTTEDWRKRMMTVVAAGPGATLVTGLAAALLLHLSGAGDSWFLWSLRAFVQVSFFIFVLGLVPNSKSLLCQNDAALFCSLWRNHPQSNEIFLYHLALQQQMTGVRPRNYPVGLMELLASAEGRPDFMAFFATTIASWAFDNGDEAAGNAWDERSIAFCDGCGSVSRTLSLVNSACFDIIYRRNPAAAKGKIDNLDVRKIVSPHLQGRARAVSHLLSGRVPEALAHISMARFTLPEHEQNSGVECLLLSHLHAAALAVQPQDLGRVHPQKNASAAI